MFKSSIFLLIIFISGCGQKGPLYLPKESHKDKEKVIRVEKYENKKIEPAVVLVNSILINAKEGIISGNNSNSWQRLLKKDELKTEEEVISYILFKSDVLNLSSVKSMYIGNIANKKTKQKTYEIKEGNYLKFRAEGKGYDKVPSSLLQIKEYFKANKTYKRVGNSDFMIYGDNVISIYIQVI